MVKKTKATKATRVSKLWPGAVTPVRALIVLSVILNVAVLVTLWAMSSTNVFDRQIVKDGVRVYCSEDYRDDLKFEDLVANDYACGKDAAKEFYINGLNEYRATKSLPALES